MILSHLFDNPYYIIFHNSLQSAISLSLRSENAWLAALGFGGYNMFLATALAFAGSTLGTGLVYALGYYISRWRFEVPGFRERFYQRISGLFGRHLFMIMAVPPVSVIGMIPLVPLFVVVNGMFRVPPMRAFAAIAVARILFYTFYLFQ